MCIRDSSKAIATGTDCKVASEGDNSIAAAFGMHSSVEVKGMDSVAAAFGFGSKAKGELGTWLVLTEYELAQNCDKSIKCVKAGQVDGITIMPNTWYVLRKGLFVEDKSNEVIF